MFRSSIDESTGLQYSICLQTSLNNALYNLLPADIQLLISVYTFTNE